MTRSAVAILVPPNGVAGVLSKGSMASLLLVPAFGVSDDQYTPVPDDLLGLLGLGSRLDSVKWGR